MKKLKLFTKITALILVITISFSCLSLTSYAVPMYDQPTVFPSLTWPYFTTSGGSQTYYDYTPTSNSSLSSSVTNNPLNTSSGTKTTDLKPIDPKVLATNLHSTLKDMDFGGSKKRDDNSFLSKLQNEYVKSKIPSLIKETIKGGAKKIGKWFNKSINGAKEWLNRRKANVKWFSKVLGKASEKWAGRLLYAKGIWDFVQDPSAPFLSPYLKLCAMGIKGFNTFVGPFLPPKLAIAMTAAEIVFTSSEVVNFLNDLYLKILTSDRPIKHMLLMPDYVVTSLYLGGKFIFEWINSFKEKEQPIPAGNGPQNNLLKDFQTKQKGASPTANGIGVYKPNIYLYPTSVIDVNVTFSEPNLLTITDPPYENGWNVMAQPDGTLNACSGEYSYLFYESLTYPGYYQKDEGFVIPSGKRRETFTDILKAYGLNDREINDFCDFWCKKLDDGKDYAMYPQLTETIDRTMPVTISPAPDSSFRIWFVFSEGEIPQKTSNPIPFERNGFVMVEWGGLFD